MALFFPICETHQQEMNQTICEKLKLHILQIAIIKIQAL